MKFCMECGKEIKDGRYKFCPGCGAVIEKPEPMSPTPTPPPKKLGALKIMGIILVTLTVFIVVLYAAGTMVTEEPYTSQVDDIPDIPLTSTYDDVEFTDWLQVSLLDYQGYFEDMKDYASDRNYDMLENLAYRYYEISGEYLDETDDFYLSKNYQGLCDEWILFLEDMEQSCWYTYIGARDLETDNINKGTEYLQKATAHINRCTALMGTLEG